MLSQTHSTGDYSSVKGKRRLEFFGFILSAFAIVVLVVSYLIYKRSCAITATTTCLSISKTYMKDISNSTRLHNGSRIAEDGLLYPSGYFWTAENKTIWGCPCMIKPCLHKCCSQTQSLLVNECLAYDPIEYDTKCESDTTPFNQTWTKVHSFVNMSEVTELYDDPDRFYIITEKYTCLKNLLSFDQKDMGMTFLLDDGKLFTSGPSPYSRENNEFCIETRINSTENLFLFCPTAEIPPRWPFIVKGIGMLVSVPCLLLTVITYCLLPQLANLHGKALICHALSLAVAFSCLGVMSVFSIIPLASSICVIIGYVTQFFLLATFYWLNVMCFDIWWVFSGLMPLRGSLNDAEKFKFMLYSGYAWGCPFVILAGTMIAEYIPDLSAAIVRPEFGVTSCFFNERDASLLYLYLPVGVLVYINTVMFMITALRLKSHSQSVKKLQRGNSRRHCGGVSTTSDVQRFNLYLKLSVVMGLSWILEILSFAVDSSSMFWIIPALINTLQGTAILYLFVCKRRILCMLNQKLFPKLELIPPEDSTKTISSARSNSSASKFSSIRFKYKAKADYSSAESSH